MASVLARDGRRVAIIERDWSEPDRIVGELLQPGGVQALAQLGLAACLEGIEAVTEKGYIIHGDGHQAFLPYPTDAKTGEVLAGRSFHHGRFVMRLREAARAESRCVSRRPARRTCGLSRHLASWTGSLRSRAPRRVCCSRLTASLAWSIGQRTQRSPPW